MAIMKVGKRWKVELWHDGARIATKRFDTKAAAVDWQSRQRRLYRDGSARDVLAQYLSVGDVVGQYLDALSVLVSSATLELRASVSRFVREAPLAQVRMSELTPEHVDDWFAWLRSHPTASHTQRKTFVEEFRFLRALFNWYRNNECPGFQLPLLKRHSRMVRYKPVEVRRVDYFMRPDECREWIGWLKEYKHPVFWRLGLFMLATGCGIGEAAGVCFDALDLDGSSCSIFRKVVYDRRKYGTLQPGAKNAGRVRSVYLPDMVVDSLRGWKGDGRFVFPDPEFGGELRYRIVQDTFDAGFEALGLPWRGTHICRHTHATLGLLATKDLSAVSAQLGHTTTRMTEHYAKVAAALGGEVGRGVIHAIFTPEREKSPQSLGALGKVRPLQAKYK